MSSCMYLAVKFLVATNCRTWQEKQDLEVEFLRGKVRDLSSQAEGLQWQLEEVEERSRTETAQLQVTTNNSVYSSWKRWRREAGQEQRSSR